MKWGTAKGWARILGSGIAHVQHGCDRLFTWGFEAMRNAGSTNKKASGNRVVATVAGTCRGVLSFLGTFGEEYYKKYEELKRKS